MEYLICWAFGALCGVGLMAIIADRAVQAYRFDLTLAKRKIKQQRDELGMYRLIRHSAARQDIDDAEWLCRLENEGQEGNA